VAAEFNRTTTTITILRKKIRTTCDFEWSKLKFEIGSEKSGRELWRTGVIVFGIWVGIGGNGRREVETDEMLFWFFGWLMSKAALNLGRSGSESERGRLGQNCGFSAKKFVLEPLGWVYWVTDDCITDAFATVVAASWLNVTCVFSVCVCVCVFVHNTHRKDYTTTELSSLSIFGMLAQHIQNTHIHTQQNKRGINFCQVLNNRVYVSGSVYERRRLSTRSKTMRSQQC
jgi:hypothetical protein